MSDEIRAKLERLLDEKHISPRQLSMMIGRSESYIQKFLKYGIPKKIPEVERRQIAEVLNIDEQELTDLPLHRIATASVIARASEGCPFTVNIDMLDVTACCGDGVDNANEKVVGKWIMPEMEFRTITFAKPNEIKMIRVSGDSMQPTLKGGDWVLVDVTRNTPDSDGMFLIRTSGGLAVKRLQAGLTDEIIVKSDNPAYDNLTAKVGEIKIIGKVIYTLKAERVG